MYAAHTAGLNKSGNRTVKVQGLFIEKLTAFQYPDWLNSTLASDPAEDNGVMAGCIRSLKPGSRVVGKAIVVIAYQDDNLVIRRLIDEAHNSPGYVLVVDGQGGSHSAMIGNILTVGIQNLGITGFITDGLVRDSHEIRHLDLQVWCRGVTPTASAKCDQGQIGGSVTIGGVLVRDDDLIIDDDDGIVVWPHFNIHTCRVIELIKAYFYLYRVSSAMENMGF